MTTSPPRTDDYHHHRDAAREHLTEASRAHASVADRQIATAQVHATLALAAATHDVEVTYAEYTDPIDLVPTGARLFGPSCGHWAPGADGRFVLTPEMGCRTCHEYQQAVLKKQMPARYVYVASSWRNDVQPEIVSMIRANGIGAYDFKDPDGSKGFAWSDVDLARTEGGLAGVRDYLHALDHPRAIEGYRSDFDAMQRADTFVLVLPCGRSAHLELGWAVGAGKRTAILLDGPLVVPELMYRMVDLITPDQDQLVAWLRGEVDGRARA